MEADVTQRKRKKKRKKMYERKYHEGWKKNIKKRRTMCIEKIRSEWQK